MPGLSHAAVVEARIQETGDSVMCMRSADGSRLQGVGGGAFHSGTGEVLLSGVRFSLSGDSATLAAAVRLNIRSGETVTYSSDLTVCELLRVV